MCVLYTYKSLTKTNIYELSILHHCRDPYNRMGIRIFRCCGRRIDPHIIGYRNYFINTWIIAQANSSLILQTVLKID